jgi:catechol 2,3-dioxygenase-like lactoylglutathione lyase family enzyme
LISAKYVHTNLVARDWRALAHFYQTVFGCVPVPPERDLAGGWLEAATGVPGAHIRGMHLRLPGYEEDGPTLEIFEYSPVGPRQTPLVNRQGFGHIAFLVEDIAATCDAVLQAGGTAVGELVTSPIQRRGVVTFLYMTDPEGNIIELQSWSEN